MSNITAADRAAAADNTWTLTVPVTAALGAVLGLVAGQAAGIGPYTGLLAMAAGALIGWRLTLTAAVCHPMPHLGRCCGTMASV